MKMAIVVAHAGASCLGEALLSWGGRVPVFVEDGKDGILPAYQRGFEAAKDFDVLAYFHDDLIIREHDWETEVLAEFSNPKVGVVGFGGALGHGSRDIYQVPYDFHQLGRSTFLSNMEDAETHGGIVHFSCDVAVLDGFSLIIRRDLLVNTGGWPVEKLGYVGYDYWLSCMAHRLCYTIRLSPVACRHLGGQTFVKMKMGWGIEHWEQYLKAHEYIYNEFKDVLPWRVP